MTVELNSQAFKILSSTTRVALLKKVAEKPRSLTSLAQEMGLTVQSTDEHLRKLQAAGFVSKSRHAKWVYYEATSAGKQVVQPKSQAVYILLSLSFFMFLAAGASLFFAGATGLPESRISAPTSESSAIQAGPAIKQAPGDTRSGSASAVERSAESDMARVSESPSVAPLPARSIESISPMTLALLITGFAALLFSGFLLYRSKR